MKTPTQIQKRNGDIVSWDQGRITRAILGAVTEVAGEDKHRPSQRSLEIADRVSQSVWEEAAKKLNNGRIPTVEEIQDIVELCLYRHGHFEEAKAYILYRAKHQELRLKTHDSSLIQDYIVATKYARYIPELKRRETWEEITERVKVMHLKKFHGLGLDQEIEEAFQAVKEKRVLPSMRSLQFGGLPIETNNARLFNCSFTHINRPRAFQEAMWLLLCGTGVGFSVQKHHIEQLPPLAHRDKEEELPVKHHTVEDTIEGWADALGELINSYIDGYLVEFNYSQIRPKGSPLKTSGGKAPGHTPLRKALESARRILDQAAGRKLRPIEAYDILMFAAKAVLSGGIRRSATICLFSPDDEEMSNAKTGNWFETNLQRSASNNSAVVLRNSTPKEVFEKLFECQKQFGEPGFYFSDDTEYGTNPCCEIGLAPFIKVTEDNIKDLEREGIHAKVGETLTGFQHCNLTTINAGLCDTKEKFFEACKLASRIGTLQAAYTNMPYLGKITEFINKREALLGVSICGFLDNPQVCLQPEVLKEGAKIVLQENERVAKILGINPAARTTCVKPEGTASLVLNTCSGIHPHHAKRYFRRVQANKREPLFQIFKKFNPQACEQSIYSPTDEVITFCIEAKPNAILLDDINAIQFLGMVKLVQENWVIPGTRHQIFNPNLYHNVSNTTTLKPEEWEEVKNYIWDNRAYFTGVSLLAKTGDKVYPQAPREAVITPVDQAKWNTLNYTKIDYKSIEETQDNTNLKEIVACAGGSCDIP